MEFEAVWKELTEHLHEPALIEITETGERFHAWYDRGGDGKPESIWTKPLQGDKQVRLSHRQENFRRVYDAAVSARSAGSAGLAAAGTFSDITLRGHYLYAILKELGAV